MVGFSISTVLSSAVSMLALDGVCVCVCGVGGGGGGEAVDSQWRRNYVASSLVQPVQGS